MLTERSCISCPGTLAMKRNEMPSFGWMRIERMFGSQTLRPRPLEEQVGRSLELNGDLRDALGEPLAVPQVERHARPAPVLDSSLTATYVSVLESGLDLFLTIARNCSPTDEAAPVLAAHRVDGDLGGHQRRDGAQHLDLLVADRVGLEVRSGGSIAISVSNCIMWFWTMSRRAPA